MKNTLLIAYLISTIYLSGQTPYSFSLNLSKPYDIGTSFPKVTNEELKEYLPKYKPKRIEYEDTVEGEVTKKEYDVYPPEIGFLRRALQYTLPLEKAIVKDSIKYLRVRILSKNANEMSLILRNTKLKEGEKLYFYTADSKIVSKAYDKYDVNDSNILSSPIIKADEIILEYNSTNFNEVGNVEIGSISHFFSARRSL